MTPEPCPGKSATPTGLCDHFLIATESQSIDVLEEHIASRKSLGAYLDVQAKVRAADLARMAEFLGHDARSRRADLAAQPGFERAIRAQEHTLRAHERAAELHRQAAEFHEQHAAGERALGHDDRAEAMERRADRERVYEELERERADRAKHEFESR